MEQNMKKGRVKGTVLFTVVAVMMVLVVFLMSTLILTTSAQRRTYYTYFETQAQYAATAALETVQNSVYSNEGFFTWMTNEAKNIGDVATMDVNFENTTIPISQTKEVNGKTVRFVTCEIRRLDDDYYWDEKNVRIVSRRTWQISATAMVGTGSQAAECVQAFVVYEPVRERLGQPDNAGVKWTGIAEGSGDGEGAGVFASTFNSGNDNVSVFGPVFSVGDAPLGRTKYPTNLWEATSIANEGIYVGRVVFTDSMMLNTTKYVTVQNAFEGLEVYGNFVVNNYMHIQSKQTPAPTQYNELGYVYVDGMLAVTGGAFSIGGVSKQENITVGNEQHVNLYAGAITASKPLTVNGDIFLHEPTLKSSFSDTGLTYLAAFVEQNVQKANYKHKGYAGGDLICANSEFVIDGNRAPSVGGDFIMTNPDSKLTVQGNGDTKIGGALICAGELIMNASKSITAAGGVYVDPTKVTVFQNLSINGVQFTNQDTVEQITTKLVQACKNASGAQASYDLDGDGQVTNTDLHKNTYNNAVVESLGAMSFIYKDGTTENEQYTSLVSEMLNCEQTYHDADGNEKKVKVGLYPFCSRLDEIFMTYIRWDLASENEATARGYLNTDELIKESKAAGHTWDVKEKTDGTTKIYVPYTTTLNEKEHGFIGEIETGDNSKLHYAGAYDTDTELPGGQPALVFSQPGTLTTQTYYYHDKDGKPANGTVNNAVYIDTSCVLDFTQNSNDWLNLANNNGTIYVDPSVNGYSSENPLVIWIKGSFSNGRLNILVNNTYDSVQGSYYADLNTFTDRDQVVIYWDDNFYAQKGNFYTTGSYHAVTVDKELDYVANPYYPGTASWTALPAGPEKYKFEYIPNTTIYMDATKTGSYELQNNSFISAFVISPYASLSMPAAGDLQVKTTYREYHASDELYSQDYANNICLIAIGGFILDDFWTNNASYMVYATDGNRPKPYGDEAKPGEELDAEGDFLISDFFTPA
ncbi:MAG: hypothetical protein E7503_01100 [Ruminococcus sp.]|nr:hypothetical protein [Ruminococcus sp.]